MTWDVTKGSAVAQLAHGFAGMALTLALLPLMSQFYAASAVVVIAAAKESAESSGLAFWEPRQAWWGWDGSIFDFVCFLPGVVVALLWMDYAVPYIRSFVS